MALFLTRSNDTRLPKQTADDIQCTPGVTQIAMYQSDAKRKTCGIRLANYPVMLSVNTFFTCDVRLVFISEKEYDFKIKITFYPNGRVSG